jgi:glycine/D-amino acid oxidase-like deaminating enzyme
MYPITDEDETVFPYANQFGSGRVKNCFYVDTKLFFDIIHALPNIQFKTEIVNYGDIAPREGAYKNEKFDHIVFCEGFQTMNNPWFQHLPVNPTKGEVLTVETEGLSQDESFNRKCFTLYVGKGQYKVGATYVWHTITTDITEEGKALLLNNLKYLTDKPVTVISQRAGIRPTTLNRRPIMTQHSDFPKLAAFNGLGAKGYLMAPLLSEEMCRLLL